MTGIVDHGQFPTGGAALNPSPFAPDAISRETQQYNADLAQRLVRLAPAASILEARARLRSGEGATPPSRMSSRARTMEISGRGGHPIELRIIEAPKPRGVFMHVHGGGWAMGANDLQDTFLEGIANRTGLSCVSIGYRLVPEHTYPAAIDDCEDAAIWLIENARSVLGSARLFLGGESAGAHLCAATLLRLRAIHVADAVAGACLAYGFFDLSLTPSARAARSTLVIDGKSLTNRATQFINDPQADLRAPEISPLQADLWALPPALFVVGTQDPLLDDSLFMHARWIAAGNRSELAVFPGGVHNFLTFPIFLAKSARLRIASFLLGLI